jgi:DNA-binding NarL/FixJ family response regulator
VLVDDDLEFRRLARVLLSRRGHVVLGEAADAAAAHQVVERCAPQLVLVDVCLGDESGFDLAGALTRAFPDLAVVLMSTDPTLGDPDRLRASGARAFLAKSQLASADPSAVLLTGA